jgi:hypothetical protein
MLVAAIILFLIAAIFGAVVLTAILKNKRTPSLLVLMHGCFAGLALLIVGAYAVVGPIDGLFITSLVFLIIAALGGFTLLIMGINKKPIPKPVAVLHPLLAGTGLILLIIFVLKMFSGAWL